MPDPRKLMPWAAMAATLFWAWPVRAWFNGGHMLVAYIAYQNLTPQIRARVDALLKLNDTYGEWTAGVDKRQMGLAAFVKAATWADCIKDKKCKPGYQDLGGNVPPGQPSDAQNIGYQDKLMHKYWHFIDEPYPDGPGRQPKSPNARTEIKLLTQAISSTASDDIKSYDVVWLEHLVGDVHQPLHTTSRFTQNHQSGDEGGNLVAFCEKPCRDELHAYWDGLLGENPSLAEIRHAGDALMQAGKPQGADEASPDAWIEEGFHLAQSAVYVPPISDDNDPSVTISPRPDESYRIKAAEVARSQAALAGYRLAALLNHNLK
ncbi:MAG TPA: S1/P1 nuclease [Bryobacteraceae bacterium]|nr:S1/P1 nuclease [Bryobacteraceae bacterium]